MVFYSLIKLKISGNHSVFTIDTVISYNLTFAQIFYYKTVTIIILYTAVFYSTNAIHLKNYCGLCVISVKASASS